MTPAPPTQTKSQQHLWGEYLAGDPLAAYQLFRVDVAPSLDIFRLCLRLTGFNIADAEEMHSRSLWKLLRRRNRYPDFETAVRAWRRFARDFRGVLAHKAARRQAILDAEPDRRAMDAIAPTDPAKVALGKDDVARLQKELPRLADHLRRAVELVGFEGLSCREAATEMGCSDKMVKAYYEQALELLRSRLGRPSAAGVLAVILSASTFGRSLPSPRLASAVTELIDTTPAAGPSLFKVAVMGFCALLAGGIGVGAYGMLRPTPEPAPTPALVPKPEPTVAEVNRIAFENDLRKEFTALFAGLGSGKEPTAEVSLETFKTRMCVSILIRHGKPPGADAPPIPTSPVRVVFDSHTRGRYWTEDYFRRGRYWVTDPKEPLILLRDVFGGKDVTNQLPNLTRADALLRDKIPADPRGAAEHAEAETIIHQKLLRYVGTWTQKKPNAQPVVLTMTQLPSGLPRLNCNISYAVAAADSSTVCVSADGQLVGLFSRDHTLSADGTRIDFADGDFWVREK